MPTATNKSKKSEKATIMNKYSAVFEKDGEWWIGWIEELPGANTQGRTLDEARQNLKEAVLITLEANLEIARREEKGRKVIREELLITIP